MNFLIDMNMKEHNMFTYEVVFLSNWKGNPYKKLLIKNLASKGVKVKEYIWSIFFLGSIFKDGKANVLHLHTLHPFFMDNRGKIHTFLKFFVFCIQLLFIKILRVKVVWTVHELNDKLYDGKGNIPPIYTMILGLVFDAFITHCETTKREVIELFRLKKPSKVHVIPHGNYIGTYKNNICCSDARQTLNVPVNATVFLCFGLIYRYKGVIETIEAFRVLDNKEVYLIIAGSPKENLREQIMSMIQGFENIILIPDLIPDDEIQLYMNACDCVVAAYKTFTTSGIVTLAMSFGKACIAPRKGYFSDTLDDLGAIFYAPDKQDGLLQAMKESTSERSRLLKMGEYNLELAKKWSWEYVSEETLNMYHSIFDIRQENLLNS